MNMTTRIEDALSGAGLSVDDFTMTGPDQLGAITVRSADNDGEQVKVAFEAVCNALPREDYLVIHSRSMEDPSFSARVRPAGI